MQGCKTKKTLSRVSWRITSIGLFLLLGAVPSFASSPWTAPVKDDADLHDVHFVNESLGWAVGDRGVILHTTDGGRSWAMQDSRTGDSLFSVHFIDSKRGWAVGASAIPYVARSRSIILRTDDGGKTWLRERSTSVPGLRFVRFFDEKRGVVLGDPSPLYPAAAFTTRDGGRSWNPFPIRTAHGWTSADFRPNGVGLLLGASGNITTCEGPDCRARPTPRLPVGKMRDIAWLDDRVAMAVGDNSTVWVSSNTGVSWTDVSSRVRDGNDRFDLHSIAVVGDRVLLAGSQGRVFSTNDFGQTFRRGVLPTTLPVTRVEPAGEGRLVAVGPLGQILLSDDNGDSFRAVRAEDRHAFALVLVSPDEPVPWPLVAQISGSYGGRLRMVTLKESSDAPLAMSRSNRVHHSALVAGANSGASMSFTELESAIHREIATWKPSLIVSDDDPRLVKMITAAQAHAPASGSTAYWIARSSNRSGQHGLAVSPLEPATIMGASVGELASKSAALLSGTWSPQSEFVRCYPANGSHVMGERIFSGFSFAPGSASRRLGPTNADNRRELEDAARHYATMQQMIRRAVQDPQRSAAWLSQIENLSTRLSPESAADLLYQLSRHQIASGDADRALQTLDTLVSRFPGMAVSDIALRDAVIWMTSREVAYRRETKPIVAAGQLAGTKDPSTRSANETPKVAAATAESEIPEDAKPKMQPAVRRGTPIAYSQILKSGPTIADQMGVRPATAQVPLPTNNPLASTPTSPATPVRPQKLSNWLERLGPEHRADPDILVAIESHRRRIDKPGARQHAVFQRLSRTLPGTWRDCAEAELALIKPERRSRKNVLKGRFGPRPHLDGYINQLDNGAWPIASMNGGADGVHSSFSIALGLQEDHAMAGETAAQPTINPAIVMVAADEQFLYFSIQCGYDRHGDYTEDDSPRTRDPDLNDQDRVEIFIDTDRDYSLGWRLTIDHRGWTGESLGSDASWNPKWYVAARHDAAAKAWVSEAAIAWSELAKSPPTVDDPWAIDIARRLPDGRTAYSVASPNRKHGGLEHASLFYFSE